MTTDEITGREERIEVMLDLSAAVMASGRALSRVWSLSRSHYRQGRGPVPFGWVVGVRRSTRCVRCALSDVRLAATGPLFINLDECGQTRSLFQL